MANIKKQLTDSLSETNNGSANISASGLITGNSGSLQHIDVDNNAVVDGDLKVSQYIKHIGNETTFINFTSNRIRFKAGDVGFDMEKDASPLILLQLIKVVIELTLELWIEIRPCSKN